MYEFTPEQVDTLSLELGAYCEKHERYEDGEEHDLANVQEHELWLMTEAADHLYER